MKSRSLLLSLCCGIAILQYGCKGESPTDPTPTNKTVTVEVIYVSGQIEGSDSWATWPVLKFPTDGSVDSFKVTLKDFDGTFANLPNGQTDKWKAGDQPPTTYSIFGSTNDIKDGFQYYVVGRTWCSGCAEPSPQWLVNYHKGFGEHPKGDVTYIYH